MTDVKSQECFFDDQETSDIVLDMLDNTCKLEIPKRKGEPEKVLRKEVEPPKAPISSQTPEPLHQQKKQKTTHDQKFGPAYLENLLSQIQRQSLESKTQVRKILAAILKAGNGNIQLELELEMLCDLDKIPQASDGKVFFNEHADSHRITQDAIHNKRLATIPEDSSR